MTSHEYPDDSTPHAARALWLSLILVGSSQALADQWPVLLPELRRLPLVERIQQTPAFPEPLEPVGGARPGNIESETLWAALELMVSEGGRSGAQALEVFLEAFPDSAWAPTVHYGLAGYYERTGRYSMALRHGEMAWAMIREATDYSTRRLADRVLARWSRLLAQLGRIEDLNRIAGALLNRQPVEGRVAFELQKVLARYSAILHRPEGVHKCGYLAVADLMKEERRPAALLRAMMTRKAPAEGFSLQQLAELAAEYGYEPLVVQWQEPGTIPYPAVAHMTVGHFVTIVAVEGDRFRVEDPGLKTTRLMHAEDLAAELSGYFMVNGGRIPVGCLVVSPPDRVRGPGTRSRQQHPRLGG
jgi:hypothetical protein